ncbi:MAG: hypothetical protein ABSB50_13970 [Terracidiphilus sp.]|jgi:hypothetical protein
MMENSLSSTHSPLLMKIVGPIVAAVAIAGAGIGYAVHEHSVAQNMTDQNSQMTAQLNSTHMQLEALTAHVNSLEASNQTKPPESAPVERAGGRRPSEHRAARPDPRFGKLQSQLDAQGKRIDAEDQQIADARTDLTNTRTELTGSIAKTHDELVVLEKKGERNYFEFDIQKSKEFKHEGPVGISLRKANAKRGYADLMLMVDDRNLQTKHVNLFQPSMFYESDSPQPIEIVINDVSKDHIHGYVSAPKYRKSELDAMATANANANQQATNSGAGDNGIVGQAPAAGADQTTDANTQPATRQRLPLPGSQPNQQ